jgi:CRISPR/Cas system endoribonuclease Cas6 (RAMP superfamily)
MVSSPVISFLFKVIFSIHILHKLYTYFTILMKQINKSFYITLKSFFHLSQSGQKTYFSIIVAFHHTLYEKIINQLIRHGNNLTNKIKVGGSSAYQDVVDYI